MGDTGERDEVKGTNAWDEFMEARNSLPSVTWLATMTDAQMKGMMARRYPACPCGGCHVLWRLPWFAKRVSRIHETL